MGRLRGRSEYRVRGRGIGRVGGGGIVSHSRGHVWAESKPDKGTTFTVLLPLVQESNRPDAPPASAVEQARRATVLVVDDEDIIRSLMKRTREEAGYEVLLARNGREALDSLARHRGAVDLVLSDLVMPIMGGRELANRLAAEYAGLPVVWMSGHPKDMAPVSSAARGGGLFLQKPLAPDVLVETVAQALERRGVRRPGAASSPEA